MNKSTARRLAKKLDKLAKFRTEMLKDGNVVIYHNTQSLQKERDLFVECSVEFRRVATKKRRIHGGKR